MLDNIDKTIIQCMNNVGIIVDEKELINSDVNLMDYNIDSILFIAFLVDVEDKLNIIIPDEYVTYEVLQSYHGFANAIKNLVAEEDKQLE